MQRYAHRTFIHSQTFSDLADRLTFDTDCTDDHLLAPAQVVNEPSGVLTFEVVTWLLGSQEIQHRIDRNLDTAPTPTQRVNQLVACNGSHPGTERLAGVPGMPLQMKRQKGLLNHVLGIVRWRTRINKSALRSSPFLNVTNRELGA